MLVVGRSLAVRASEVVAVTGAKQSPRLPEVALLLPCDVCQ